MLGWWRFCVGVLTHVGSGAAFRNRLVLFPRRRTVESAILTSQAKAEPSPKNLGAEARLPEARGGKGGGRERALLGPFFGCLRSALELRSSDPAAGDSGAELSGALRSGRLCLLRAVRGCGLRAPIGVDAM